MSAATTVTGRLEADHLGLVLPHEHLLADRTLPLDAVEAWEALGRRRPVAAGDVHRYEQPLEMRLLGEVGTGAPLRDNLLLDDEETALAELRDHAAHGGGALVEATTADLGRDPAALRRLSEASGVPIVMGSGWHHPAFCPEVAHGDADDLAARIVRDLREGVDGVRAGLVGGLAALDPDRTAERTLLTAAARAAAATGAPLLLERSADPDAQARALALLAEEGVDPARVAVGGCDGLAPEPDRLEALLDAGVHVLFDGLGRLPTVHSDHDDQDVAAAVLELARRGHGERLLLSCGVATKDALKAYGGGGHAFLPQQFLMFLRMIGGDDALVERITVDNPRRLLTTTEAES